MDMLNILYRRTGFKTNKSIPDFLPSIEKLFNILKEHVKEVYRLEDALIDSISFDHINSFGLFSETIKVDKYTKIIFGANLNALLDWSNSFLLTIDNEEYKLISHLLISKIAIQQAALNGRMKQAYVLSGHAINIIEECERKGFSGSSFISSFMTRNNAENHKHKMMKYIFMLAHEFGHVLYVNDLLTVQSKKIYQHINNCFASCGIDFMRKMYQWNNTLGMFKDITNDQLKSGNIDRASVENEMKLYEIIGHKGTENFIFSLEKIKHNERVIEELVCDLFAFEFVLEILGEDISKKILPDLYQLQVLLTLSSYFFSNPEINYTYSFLDAYSRYLVAPFNTDYLQDENLFWNDNVAGVLQSYVISLNKSLQPEFDELDLLYDQDLFSEVSEVVYSLGLLEDPNHWSDYDEFNKNQ